MIIIMNSARGADGGRVLFCGLFFLTWKVSFSSYHMYIYIHTSPGSFSPKKLSESKDLWGGYPKTGWNSDPIERCFLGFNQAVSGILDNKLTPPDIAEQRKCVQQTAELGQEKAFASRPFIFRTCSFFYRSIIYVAKLTELPGFFF